MQIDFFSNKIWMCLPEMLQKQAVPVFQINGYILLSAEKWNKYDIIIYEIVYDGIFSQLFVS